MENLSIRPHLLPSPNATGKDKIPAARMYTAAIKTSEIKVCVKSYATLIQHTFILTVNSSSQVILVLTSTKLVVAAAAVVAAAVVAVVVVVVVVAVVVVVVVVVVVAAVVVVVL